MMLAYTYQSKVGILDIDLCGPSIPQLLNLKSQSVHKSSTGWVPVFADNLQQLSVMSLGFLVDDQDAAVVWRGPKKNGMLFVVWG
eukprot:CAMPEP_0174257244 /NCGR_PEP_ID=MMETSP0439-20130205/6410_1 /TAXON_ID=0 /ORGANISM="Stereomyxa ramosa, Strain Chinc5" /LENGTH=84 /DNA_ID=CAMNT_0015340247 /DNA_START=92 /DNA_END=346 /DNA_ORIENTATION=-